MLKLPETSRTFKIVDLKSLKANQNDGAFETGPDCSETSVFFVESLMISSSSWTLLLEGL